MLVLGMNYGGFHDASAAISVDGEIRFAVAEERLSRIKHDGGFPVHAVRACLDHMHAGAADLDRVVLGWQSPYAILRMDTLNHLSGLPPTGPAAFVKSLAVGLIRSRETDGRRLFARHFPAYAGTVERIEHHFAHALSAYAVSGFDEATVVVIDGRGAWESTTVWRGRAGTVELVTMTKWPNSIGLFYGEFTAYLGFQRYQDEWKVMGLAPYGGPGVDMSHFMRVTDDGYRVNAAALLKQAPRGHALEIEERFGPARTPDEPIDDRHRAIAWAAQDACERAEMSVIRSAVKAVGSRNLCLAGGVALNSKANGLFLREGLADRIFVQPAAGDDGVALGAALAPSPGSGTPRRAGAMNAYLGTEISSSTVEDALRVWKIPYQSLADPSDTAAGLLAQGQLLGWVQGREEFGPRALGNRSILADPRDAGNRDRVNNAVKFRESWRPFAPSMLHESGPEFLENYHETPYMTLTFQVRSGRRHEIAAAVHVDGSARVQSVTRAQNPRYYDLIRRFADRTGVPAVLNTSFNLKGEAMVGGAFDAIRTFHTSGLDALIIDRFLVRKNPQ